MKYFLTIMMMGAFFLLGCGGVATEDDVSSDAGTRTGVAQLPILEGCDMGTAEGICGIPVIFCLATCAAATTAVTGGELITACGAVCAPGAVCMGLLSDCWNGGVGGSSGDQTPPPGSSPPASGCNTSSLTLDAAVAGWTDTGINVTGASSVNISASGNIIYASSGATQDANSCNPPGLACTAQSGGGWTDCPTTSCQAGCGSFPFRAVMGKWGNGGPFNVGTAFDGTPTGTGNLFLTLNDCYFSDNSGSFSISVTVCR